MMHFLGLFLVLSALLFAEKNDVFSWIFFVLVGFSVFRLAICGGSH